MKFRSTAFCESRVQSESDFELNRQICYQYSSVSLGPLNKEPFNDGISKYRVYQWVSGNSEQQGEFCKLELSRVERAAETI